MSVEREIQCPTELNNFTVLYSPIIITIYLDKQGFSPDASVTNCPITPY
jgi:hypothetical protein